MGVPGERSRDGSRLAVASQDHRRGIVASAPRHSSPDKGLGGIVVALMHVEDGPDIVIAKRLDDSIGHQHNLVTRFETDDADVRTVAQITDAQILPKHVTPFVISGAIRRKHSQIDQHLGHVLVHRVLMQVTVTQQIGAAVTYTGQINSITNDRGHDGRGSHPIQLGVGDSGRVDLLIHIVKRRADDAAYSVSIQIFTVQEQRMVRQQIDGHAGGTMTPSAASHTVGNDADGSWPVGKKTIFILLVPNPH
jgi:hypothetical protein